MIALVAKCFVKDGKTNDFMALAKSMVTETQKENGCIFYNIFKNNETDNEFAFIEQWESEESLEAHKVSRHFKNLVPEIAKIADFELNSYSIC